MENYDFIAYFSFDRGMKDPAGQNMYFNFFFTDKQIDNFPDETHS